MTEAQLNVLDGICGGYNDIAIYQLSVAVKLVELGLATIEKHPTKKAVQLLPTRQGRYRNGLIEKGRKSA